eukprot:6196444-Pleurochrysis_carterae.AAC.3
MSARLSMPLAILSVAQRHASMKVWSPVSTGKLWAGGKRQDMAEITLGISKTRATCGAHTVCS